jgi:hypothetical protein
MLTYLAVTQTLLIIWLLVRKPNYFPLSNAFVQVLNSLERIENELSKINRRLGPGPESVEDF